MRLRSKSRRAGGDVGRRGDVRVLRCEGGHALLLRDAESVLHVRLDGGHTPEVEVGAGAEEREREQAVAVAEGHLLGDAAAHRVADEVVAGDACVLDHGLDVDRHALDGVGVRAGGGVGGAVTAVVECEDAV
jgi:hypothetical protein